MVREDLGSPSGQIGSNAGSNQAPVEIGGNDGSDGRIEVRREVLRQGVGGPPAAQVSSKRGFSCQDPLLPRILVSCVPHRRRERSLNGPLPPTHEDPSAESDQEQPDTDPDPTPRPALPGRSAGWGRTWRSRARQRGIRGGVARPASRTR